MRSCASIVLVFLNSVCSAVAMGGGQPLSSFDELLSMAVLTASWRMLLMADGHLAVCGRADGRDVVVDGILWPLGAVQRHLPF